MFKRSNRSAFYDQSQNAQTPVLSYEEISRSAEKIRNSQETETQNGKKTPRTLSPSSRSSSSGYQESSEYSLTQTLGDFDLKNYMPKEASAESPPKDPVDDLDYNTWRHTEELPSIDNLKKEYKKNVSFCSFQYGTLFHKSVNSDETIRKLRERAKNNPNGASAKTLQTFGLS